MELFQVGVVFGVVYIVLSILVILYSFAGQISFASNEKKLNFWTALTALFSSLFFGFVWMIIMFFGFISQIKKGIEESK